MLEMVSLYLAGKPYMKSKLNNHDNAQFVPEQNRTEQNFIGNYKAPATPRWHKSKPYSTRYKKHTKHIHV